MVSQNPAKFGGNGNCDGGDVRLLVIEEQDFSYFFKSAVSIISEVRGMWHAPRTTINKT